MTTAARTRWKRFTRFTRTYALDILLPKFAPPILQRSPMPSSRTKADFLCSRRRSATRGFTVSLAILSSWPDIANCSVSVPNGSRAAQSYPAISKTLLSCKCSRLPSSTHGVPTPKPGWTSTTPTALASKLHDPKYQIVTGSWIEKRKDIEDGVAALSSPLRQQAETRLTALIPGKPSPTGLTLLAPGQILDTRRIRLGFDPITGAITHLENKRTGENLASKENSLALFTYQTLSKADYDRFLSSYITVQTDWAPKDFGKPNIESFGAKSRRWCPSSTRIWHGESSGKALVMVELAFDPQSPDGITAWPASAYLTINIPDDEAPINLALSWFEKRANRLPEALWLTFQPIVSEPRNWTLSKVERPVSPFDVVSGGNRHMHALTGPLTYRDSKTQLSIDSLDAAVVSLGVMSHKR